MHIIITRADLLIWKPPSVGNKKKSKLMGAEREEQAQGLSKQNLKLSHPSAT
jgi:hypothetical protein